MLMTSLRLIRISPLMIFSCGTMNFRHLISRGYIIRMRDVRFKGLEIVL